MNTPQVELVVLVDEKNNVLGSAPKATVHTTDTPLHRGFSVFLFNAKGEVLLTKRASTKKTFPGVWTNTVCGHPFPDERSLEAAHRRLRDELGIDVEFVKKIANYRYRFADKNGIVENEICPVFIAYDDQTPVPNPDEVDEWKWMDWQEFLNAIHAEPEVYSPWCREEALFVVKELHMTGFPAT